MILLFCVIVWRLLDLSYFNRGKYYKSLEQARSSIVTIPAKRGTIFDRNFETLACDKTRIVLGVDPYVADSEKDLQKIFLMSELLDINIKKILEKFVKRREISNNRERKVRWVPICEIDSDSLYSAIKAIKIRGVYGIKNPHRSYPFGREMAHITGFIGRENVPVCGVERYMNFYLQGQDGYIESEKDGRTMELVQYRKKEIPCKDGNDIVLTIDKNIQKIVYDEVTQLVEKFSPKSVSVIVSEVLTGEIFALVNYPDYDPNNYGKFSPESMKNLAVCNIYEPGSVFKIIAMSFGLEYGLVDENSVFDCTLESVMNRGKKISMPKDHTPFDKLTFVEAIRKSSNRAVVQMAMLIGEQNFYDCVRAYGFGEKAGYGFDAESAGILWPTSKWDAWTITRMPMGHSVGAVPMQTHCAISVIASDGILLKPNLFKYVMEGNEKILTVNPVIRRRVISPQTALRMRKIMHNPQNGKLKNGIEFGGKSGTGQKIINGKYSHSQHTSSYCGFFPVDVPKIIITVIVDDAKVEHGIAWGSAVSLPAFKNIAEKIAQYLDL
ncbi:MAG: penicillin-binding protein 2 [Puniceicoccales bacterium]|nr:penicillin-binding protein 2 [Puniceicoccales bacterium]